MNIVDRCFQRYRGSCAFEADGFRAQASVGACSDDGQAFPAPY